jgi:hypothetical protein
MRSRSSSTFGTSYDPAIDAAAIRFQMDRIRELMLAIAENDRAMRHREAGYRTLAEIAAATGDGEASVSAQLRHLRKKTFGAWIVEKRRRGGGRQWEYRVLRPAPPPIRGEQLALDSMEERP